MSDRQAGTGRSRSTSEDAAGVGHRQRRKILQALDRCMRTRGYAAISVADIAAEADMSPSHLRYYFDSKEKILESYFERLCDHILADLLRIERSTPEEWLDKFVDYTMGAGNTDRESLAILIEIFAVAVHNEALGKLKARFDAHVARVYLEFFQWAGTQAGIDPYEAAYRARWLEIGAKMTALFQREFSLDKARAIFREQIRDLADMPDEAVTSRKATKR